MGRFRHGPSGARNILEPGRILRALVRDNLEPPVSRRLLGPPITCARSLRQPCARTSPPNFPCSTSTPSSAARRRLMEHARSHLRRRRAQRTLDERPGTTVDALDAAERCERYVDRSVDSLLARMVKAADFSDRPETAAVSREGRAAEPLRRLSGGPWESSALSSGRMHILP